MDARDQLSSSMSVSKEGNDGGGSGGDDDVALSVTATLAKEASMLFQSEKFAECVEVLNQLLQKKEGDPKILHNFALVEFFRDGCSDPKKLVEVLVNVKTKSEDLARESGEQVDVLNQAANKSNPGSKGNDNLANNTSVAFSDQFDASVVALNIATILFHLHEYSKALSVLDLLFQKIEPIDETTALHVCLLLLDIAFVTQDAPKFLDVINYLEKAFGVSYMFNQADCGSTGQQQTSNLVGKSSSVPNNSSTSDELNSDGTITGLTSEGVLSRTLSDETIKYETLLSKLNTRGQNISRPSNISASSDISRAAADRATPSINLKLHLPLYKIQLMLLTRNFKAAKREVKQAMNIARGIDSSRALLLKSQLEYARGNYSKSFKLLKASGNQADVRSSIMINNNIGCIYFQQGKHHIASIFFHKALSSCSSFRKEKPRKLTTFSQDKSLLVSYNCGVQYLACGKPLLAAHCLLKATIVFYNRPLLWLRLAECCLAALEKGFLKHNENSTHELQFKVHVIGEGKWRQLTLEDGALSNGSVNPNEQDDLVTDSNIKAKPSLPFARQCLLNALHLASVWELKKSSLSMDCDSSETAVSKDSINKNSSDPKSRDISSSGQASANGDTKEQRAGTHGNAAAANTISEYEDMRRRENQKIKQAILIDLAFVELELGNPLKALSAAVSLFEIPECSKMHTFWGHVYAAEALCLMNRPKEAAEHLSTYFSGDNNLELPYSVEDCQQWLGNKTLDTEDLSTGQTATQISVSKQQEVNVFLRPEEARQTLYVNLASMYAVQGDYEQANRFTTQALAIMPNHQEAAFMAIYLDLKLGNAHEALTKLKRFCRVRFLPHSLQPKAAS